MLKVTLPSGVIVEGDSADEVGNMVNTLQPRVIQVTNEVVHVEVSRQPEPDPEPGPEKIVERPVLESPMLSTVTYPHRYAPNGKRAINIGEREDQILQVAKVIAEENNNRCQEFTSVEIFELADNCPSVNCISSALQSLRRKGLVRHGKNRRYSYVTEKGWNSYYRVTQPITVRATT